MCFGKAEQRESQIFRVHDPPAPAPSYWSESIPPIRHNGFRCCAVQSHCRWMLVTLSGWTATTVGRVRGLDMGASALACHAAIGSPVCRRTPWCSLTSSWAGEHSAPRSCARQGTHWLARSGWAPTSTLRLRRITCDCRSVCDPLFLPIDPPQPQLWRLHPPGTHRYGAQGRWCAWPDRAT